MSLTKQDLDQIQKIVKGSETRIESKIQELNSSLLDAIEGTAQNTYSNYPTREEIKKGLEVFRESVTVKTS